MADYMEIAMAAVALAIALKIAECPLSSAPKRKRPRTPERKKPLRNSYKGVKHHSRA